MRKRARRNGGLWITEQLMPPESFAQQKGRQRGVTSNRRRNTARLFCAMIEAAFRKLSERAWTNNNVRRWRNWRDYLGCFWAAPRPVVSSRAETAQGDEMDSRRNRKKLILSRTDMMRLVTAAEYVSCVEQAYRMHGEGRYYMDPKGHIVLDKYPGEWEAMPSYIEEPEAAACKWVSIRERNREKFDLPTVFSILIYTHPETGFPLAICDGS